MDSGGGALTRRLDGPHRIRYSPAGIAALPTETVGNCMSVARFRGPTPCFALSDAALDFLDRRAAHPRGRRPEGPRDRTVVRLRLPHTGPASSGLFDQRQFFLSPLFKGFEDGKAALGGEGLDARFA